MQGDIGDAALVTRLLAERRPRAIVNFAAESHVDRSIHGAEDFIATNIVGTYRLLESARAPISAAWTRMGKRRSADQGQIDQILGQTFCRKMAFIMVVAALLVLGLVLGGCAFADV